VTRIDVPACEGRAVRVEAGKCFRVIDLDGGQVCDMWVFVAADPGEWQSAEHTRAAVRRLFPAVGESFVTNRRRRILTLVRDESPGLHDMLIAACDPVRYVQYGVEEPHASCADNLRRALSAHGVELGHVPQPINLLMNTPPGADGRIVDGQAQTTAGDSTVFRAELDCVVVVSACPFDVFPISSGPLTGLAIELVE
jgi:uncharacterized protein YcgI (DUF1989 family)